MRTSSSLSCLAVLFTVIGCASGDSGGRRSDDNTGGDDQQGGGGGGGTARDGSGGGSATMDAAWDALGPSHADTGAEGAPHDARVSVVADGGAQTDSAAAPTDGGAAPMGQSRCGTADVLLCEGFENGLATGTWRTSTSGGTVAVDTRLAARGTRALRVTSSNGGMNAISQTKTFPVANNSMFFRMFVWLEDDITTNGHFTFAEARGSGNPSAVRFGGISKRVGVGSDYGPSGDWTDIDRNAPLPAKRWICYESQYDGATNMFRVWIDDKESTPLHTGINRHPNFVMPNFTSIWFGWVLYQRGEAQEMWIDEIAIDNKRIGCMK